MYVFPTPTLSLHLPRSNTQVQQASSAQQLGQPADREDSIWSCVLLTAHGAHGDASRNHCPRYDQATGENACREPRNPHCCSGDGLAFGVDDTLAVLLFLPLLLSLVLRKLRRGLSSDTTRQLTQDKREAQRA